MDIPNTPLDTSHDVLKLIGSEFLHLPLDRRSAAKHGGKHGLICANAVVCSIEVRDELGQRK